jgi:Domain of unknown function (DUF1844)
MSDNPSGFTVTDRRKFTLEGALRDESAASSDETSATEAPSKGPAAESARPQAAAAHVSGMGKHVVDPELEPLPDEVVEGEGDFEIPELTAQESADQHAAYSESTKQLDEMLAKSSPGTRRPAATEMDFEKLVQSIYMTAALQLGAGTQPGEQPRVDILGARQSIDMLNVLGEKTKGNLTDKEQRLLQNALFELRMTFLEITNAIASSAQNPPAGKGPSRGGGLH